MDLSAIDLAVESPQIESQSEVIALKATLGLIQYRPLRGVRGCKEQILSKKGGVARWLSLPVSVGSDPYLDVLLLTI